MERIYDYSLECSWLKLDQSAKHEVDVLYVLPTCIMEGNGDAVPFGENDKAQAQFVYSIQAKVFEGLCNIFAPYYRQTPLAVAAGLTSVDEVAEFVRSRAGVEDIRRSFDYYFEHYNNDRPFILASHSQGSAMMRWILDTYFKDHNPRAYKRMIACYALGFSLPERWFTANPHIHKAVDATGTGVVIGWNTEGPDAQMPSMLTSSDDYLINPLTWSCSEELATNDLNMGSLVRGTVIPGYADARIDLSRRALICTKDTDFIGAPIFGDKSLHGGDWSLYWLNIQQNAKDRIEQYRQNTKKNNF